MPSVHSSPSPAKPSSTGESQSSPSKFHASIPGGGPAQIKPPAPSQWLSPGQLPKPLSLVHAAPPPTPSSITKLPSLSWPPHVSGAGTSASHADQPVTSSQVS